MSYLSAVPSHPEERRGPGPGLAGIILIIVIAWALAAVVMLTGTLVNARQIDHRVTEVNRQVDPIEGHTAFIKLAATTAAVTTQIRQAAQPLSGELAQVVAAATQINGRVTSILSRAQSINGAVTSINASAHSINTSVQSINTNVQSISGHVASVGSDVASIHSRVGTVATAVGPVGATDSSINGDVSGIDSRLARTLSTAHSIRTGVIGINNRAQTVIDLVALLKADFDPILAAVGTVLGTPTILGHANSIDCAPLIHGSNCGH